MRRLKWVRRKTTSRTRIGNHQENKEQRMQKKTKEKVWRKPPGECVSAFFPLPPPYKRLVYTNPFEPCAVWRLVPQAAIAQEGLELTMWPRIALSFWSVFLCHQAVLGVELRALHMLGKHSVCWATSPALFSCWDRVSYITGWLQT